MKRYRKEKVVGKGKVKVTMPPLNIIEEKEELTKKLNVKTFGAKGNGVTDDTIPFQLCFNALEERGSVYIPEGTYIVDGIKMMNKKEVTIVGEGKRSIIKLKNNSQSKYVLNIEDCPRLLCEYITIDGNKSNERIESSGIVVSRSEFSNIQNCNIIFCNGNGIEFRGVMIKEVFEGTNVIQLINNYIEQNNGHGLFIDSVLDITISENNIQFNEKNGVRITQTTGIISGNITINDNHILSNDIDGIEVDKGTSRVIISSNNIRNNGRYGLRWVEGKQFLVVGNNFHVNGRINVGAPAAIIGYNNKGFFIGNTFSCTDFKPTQAVAIEMYSSKKMYLIGNDVEDNQENGIYIDADSECYCYGNDRIPDTNNNGLSNIYLDTDNTRGNKVPDVSASTGKVFCGSLNEKSIIVDGNTYKCKHLIYNLSLRCKISNNVIHDNCLFLKVNDKIIGSLRGDDFDENNTWSLKTFPFDASNSNTLKVTVETGNVGNSGTVCVEYVIITPHI